MAGPANILLIGGSGFLSGTIARTALSQGHRVWAVTRGERPLLEGVVGLRADRHDATAFAAAVTGANTQWDLAVDCIAYDPADIVQDIEVLAGLARQFVFISSDFVYDPAKRRFPQPLDSPYTPLDDYGGRKRQCELELAARCPAPGFGAKAMPWTVFRPCHIYGPGSQLGCLPMHGRDPRLIARMQAGETLELVGGGHFLQQPILARDLAEMTLSVIGNERAFGKVFPAAGPDIVESQEYYRIVAEVLDVELRIEELPVTATLASRPEMAPFFCHRIYDLATIGEHGLKTPSTPICAGLREHVASLR